MEVSIETVERGHDAEANPGDFILIHRRGFASWLIGIGQWLKYGNGHWSHCAYMESPETLIEALGHGVVRTPLSKYRDVEYIVVHTNLSAEDEAQATAFAQSCIGQRYGFLTIAGMVLLFWTPGSGLWFGMNGTEICSGLVGQTQVRGWANFPWNPASSTPMQLCHYYAALTPA